MKHTEDEIVIAGQVTAGGTIFLLEEYWEEDDSGYCCVDYILAKHTRVTAIDEASGSVKKIFDLDGLEYDKSMTLDGDILTVVYRPEYGILRTCRIDIPTLTVIDNVKTDDPDCGMEEL